MGIPPSTSVIGRGRFSGLFLGKAGRLRSKDASTLKAYYNGVGTYRYTVLGGDPLSQSGCGGKKSRFPKNAVHKVKVFGPFQVQNLYSVLQISAPILFFAGD